jgi:hypothetical protein
MTLVEIILKKIPTATFERVVTDQGILSEKDRTGLFKASGLSPQEIAEKTIEAYGENVPRLASGLYDQVWDSGDWETAQTLLELFQSAKDVRYQNHQASLVARIPNVPLAELGTFLDDVKRQVCLIVCRKGNGGRVARGTGFLVAPDLVLTCRHVLAGFSPGDDILADGNRIELYFDFAAGKEPVEDVGSVLPGARKIGLLAQWHVASCPATSPDGMVGELSAGDVERISKSLDFVLLKLDQEVGLQPVDGSGGRRREWIKLPPDELPEKLGVDDWIIIPQHPNGFPLRIDFGRFRMSDQTETRIRYSTNTAPGTSGAPCFNHKFHLVGIHNAQVGPADKPLANQAIRFDFVAARIRAHLANLPAVDQHARRWSVSRGSEAPRVILGRDTLLSWLELSRRPPAALRERVFVAMASEPGAGCTFSSEILHSEIREKKIPRAVYGSSGQQLPSTAEDFLISLLREIGIDSQSLPPGKQMPPRPGAAATGALPAEVDKLERWLSDELPMWLGDVISSHVEREFDARVAAQQAIAYLEQIGGEITEGLKKTANAEAPIIRRQELWDCAYVVIDDLRELNYNGGGLRTNFSREVISLVAALVKGKPESAMHPGLKRLRWMFLGYLPDFIGVAQLAQNIDGATVEKLDPASVARKEVVGLFNRISEARLPFDRAFATATADYILIQVAGPENRLARLQDAVSQYAGLLLKAKTN